MWILKCIDIRQAVGSKQSLLGIVGSSIFGAWRILRYKRLNVLVSASPVLNIIFQNSHLQVPHPFNFTKKNMHRQSDIVVTIKDVE